MGTTRLGRSLVYRWCRTLMGERSLDVQTRPQTDMKSLPRKVF